MQGPVPTATAASVEHRLDSWKAIAEYLGHDVSTVMRWERSGGLPVHRVPGGKGRSVFAYVPELENWLTGHRDVATREVPARRPPRQRRLGGGVVAVLAATAALGLGAAGVWMWFRLSERPTIGSARLSGTVVVALDGEGREVWRHPLNDPRNRRFEGKAQVVDVDGDSVPEVLVTAGALPDDGAGTGVVMLLDGGGRLLWQRSLDDRFRFGGVDYGPAWFPTDALAYRTPRGPRIAVAFHHQTWWPAVVVAFDANGQTVGRFVNAGWVYRLALAGRGRFLIASGVSNAFRGAALAVLDPEQPDGTSPSAGGALPDCSNCPAGSPAAYLVVPWSDIARPADTPPVTVQVTESGQIDLRVQQRSVAGNSIPEIIVSLSPSLEVVHRGVSDAFAEVHRALERSGEVSHPVARCPWLVPPVRAWTVAHGWRELR